MLKIVVFLGVTGTLSMCLVGMIPNKLIGFAYVKPKSKTVKISYLDNWGRRQDVHMPIQDLVPLSDLPVSVWDPVYLTLRTFTSNQTFKLNMKLGVVLDDDKFNDVFLQKLK